jgi:Ribbon-helix-helix protein, copG family
VSSKGRVEHPNAGLGAPTDPHVRLSVNLNPEVADELKQYAGRKGISITEAVRRAITVLAFVDSAQSRGASLHLEEGGALKEILFLS